MKEYTFQGIEQRLELRSSGAKPVFIRYSLTIKGGDKVIYEGQRTAVSALGQMIVKQKLPEKCIEELLRESISKGVKYHTGDRIKYGNDKTDRKFCEGTWVEQEHFNLKSLEGSIKILLAKRGDKK